jgi:hypothetical protein
MKPLESKDLTKLYNKFLKALVEFRNELRQNVVDGQKFEISSYNFEQQVSNDFTMADEFLKGEQDGDEEDS